MMSMKVVKAHKDITIYEDAEWTVEVKEVEPPKVFRFPDDADD